MHKNGKSPGPDGLPINILKKIENTHMYVLAKRFVCSDQCTFSLMPHTLNMFLKIIPIRTYTKLDMYIEEMQSEFRNCLGTCEALSAFNVFNPDMLV